MKREELKNHNVTIRDFEGGHWLLLEPEVAVTLTQELDSWIQEVVVASIEKVASHM